MSSVMDEIDVTREEETSYLKQVVNDVDIKLKELKSTIARYQDKVQDAGYGGYEAASEARYARSRITKGLEDQKKYSEIKKVPYFVRIRALVKDPKKQREEISDFYIGKNDYYPYQNRSQEDGIRILNWYDKESNLYYDNNNQFSDTDNVRYLDDKEYQLNLVRKFNIEDSKLLHFYTTFEDGKPNSAYANADPYFLQVLNQKRSHGELSDIINTIQSSQNRIIREDVNKNFILQGCAGSGKTLILLHRLAYLYGNGQIERFNPVYILTPNRQFNEYISSVKDSLGLNIDKITTLSLEEYYLLLIRKYFNGVRKNNEFSFEGMEERTLDQNFLSRIYSDEFYEEVRNEYFRLWEEMEEKYPLPFEVFEHFSRTKNTLVSMSESMEQIHLEHESEFRSLGKIENRSDQLRSDLAGLVKSENNIVQVFREYLNRFIEAAETADREKIQQFLEDDRKNLKKKQQKLSRSMSGIIARTKDLRSEEYTNEKLKEYGREFAKLLDELADLTDSGSLEITDSDSNELRLLKTKIGENPYRRYLDQYLNDLRQFKSISRRVEIIELSLKKNNYFNDNCAEAVEEARIFLSQFNDHNPLLLMSHKSGPYISGEYFQMEIQEIQNDIRAKKKELSELNAERNEISQNLFGRAVSVSELQMQLQEINTIWNWDNLFRILIKEHLPAEFREIVKDRKMDYRFNLYLVLLLAELYFQPLSMDQSMLNIDEAQDISVPEFRLMMNIHSSSCTYNLYGDVQQNIYTYRGISNWKKLTDNFPQLNVLLLNQNYRNPSQITRYCNKIFSTTVDAIGEGTQVVRHVSDFDQALKAIINDYKNDPIAHFAVIYKNKTFAELVQEKLRKLLPEVYEKIENPIPFFSVHEAKGMEFQYVLSLTDSMAPNEKYVSYTRALKSLVICDENCLDKYSLSEHVSYNDLIWPEYPKSCFGVKRSDEPSENVNLLFDEFNLMDFSDHSEVTAEESGSEGISAEENSSDEEIFDESFLDDLDDLSAMNEPSSLFSYEDWITENDSNQPERSAPAETENEKQTDQITEEESCGELDNLQDEEEATELNHPDKEETGSESVSDLPANLEQNIPSDPSTGEKRSSFLELVAGEIRQFSSAFTSAAASLTEEEKTSGSVMTSVDDQQAVKVQLSNPSDSADMLPAAEETITAQENSEEVLESGQEIESECIEEYKHSDIVQASTAERSGFDFLDVTSIDEESEGADNPESSSECIAYETIQLSDQKQERHDFDAGAYEPMKISSSEEAALNKASKTELTVSDPGDNSAPITEGIASLIPEITMRISETLGAQLSSSLEKHFQEIASQTKKLNDFIAETSSTLETISENLKFIRTQIEIQSEEIGRLNQRLSALENKRGSDVMSAEGQSEFFKPAFVEVAVSRFSDLQSGDRVCHPRYGMGTVRNIGLQKLVVDFENSDKPVKLNRHDLTEIRILRYS